MDELLFCCPQKLSSNKELLWFYAFKIVVVIVNYNTINFDVGEVRVYIKEYEN